ncbi:sensor domain-containing diguanylate cyclase [Actinoplanes sp. Pm04-4]|uniref:Sensor domain-containing diguanylate cyclase n=1 Tax=Paractinoplanes pyxinae TaxID=2997416 RepID=A0ABT4BGS9_9ACTN|nr:sensor domain-containing diguanylate cyclase [Actinoplanes pyxinae]MCY1145714.1 sensor domain-containing diguanylate cyclase [Actinoplanes pyxinae]
MTQRAHALQRWLTRVIWADPVTRWCAVVCLAAASWFVYVVLVSPVEPMLAGWCLTPVTAALAASVCWRSGSTAGRSPASRDFWRRVAVALSVFSASMTVMTVDAVNPDLSMTTRLSVTSATLHAAGLGLLMWPLFTLPVGARSRTQRVALWLDLGTVAVAAMTFAWHFAADAILAAPGRSTVTTSISIALISGGLVCVLIIAKVALGGTPALHPRALYLLGAALGVGGLGTALVVVFVQETSVDTSLLVVPVAVLLIAVAAQQDLIRTGDPAPAAVTRPRRRFSVLPYVAVAATDALMIVAIADDADDRLLVAAAGVGLTALVACRQIVVFRENDILLTRLDAGLLDLRHAEQRFRSLVQNSTDVVSIADAAGNLTYVSPSVHRVLGRRPEVLVGMSFTALTHPDDQATAAAATTRVTAEPGATDFCVLRLRHADGSWRWLEVTSANLLHDPSVAGVVSNARDVTETRLAQDRLQHQATHDDLTGLPNRALFTERLAACTGQDAGKRFSVIIVDLDGFKTVNDTLGHAAGDGLLIAVAGMMRAGVRAQDTVARLGGDEFVILLDGISGSAVDQTVARIIAAFTAPVVVDEHRLVTRASFGIAEGRPGDDPAQVMRHADIAMYNAKTRGNGGYTHYRDGMRPPSNPDPDPLHVMAMTTGNTDAT